MKNEWIMIKPFLLLFGLSFLSLLYACGSNSAFSKSTIEVGNSDTTPMPNLSVTEDNNQKKPYIFATSELGFITLKGRLLVLDPRSIIPAADDSIFLVPIPKDATISTIPQFENKSDVYQAEVDEHNGEFVFTNIEPGRYAVVVITISGTQFPVRKYDDGSLAIIDVLEEEVDTVFNIGDLTLP